MTQDEVKYASAGRELLEKAQEGLSKGDLRQASEKGWGAAAQMVKAVAVRRGWQHGGHADLFTGVRRLMLETGDRRLQENFHAANSLHYNFYEDRMQSEDIEVAIDQVGEFVQRMESFLTDQT